MGAVVIDDGGGLVCLCQGEDLIRSARETAVLDLFEPVGGDKLSRDQLAFSRVSPSSSRTVIYMVLSGLEDTFGIGHTPQLDSDESIIPFLASKCNYNPTKFSRKRMGIFRRIYG